MTCDKNCGFEDMPEEEMDEMWLDACTGQILWKYLEDMEDAINDPQSLRAIVVDMLDEINEMLDEAGETIH